MFNSIKAKLFGIIGFIVVLIITNGFLSYYLLHHVSLNLEEVLNHHLPVTRNLALIDMVHDGIKGTATQLIYGLETNKPEEIDEAKKSLLEFEKTVSEYFVIVKKAETNGEMKNDLISAEESFGKYIQSAKNLVKLSDERNLKQTQFQFEVLKKQFDVLEKSLEVLGEKFETDSKLYFNAIQKNASFYNQLLWVFLTVGLLLIVGISYLVSRSIVKSLGVISDDLARNSVNLGVSISQLTVSSEELSSAVSEESAALEQTAASVEEISAMVMKSSQNADQSSQASLQSKLKAEKGQQVMNELIGAIMDINKSNDSVVFEVNESNNRTNEILKVIQEIGNKTKVINDIVFQTKLLSFNASVEAARAGENGKGFAVVAEEVGNLAQMSGNAAKEITSLLDESLSRVEKIAEESKKKIEKIMVEAKETVDRGTGIAKDFERVLQELVDGTTKVSDLVNDISIAAQEQSKGVGEISKAINQLNQATQVNALAAETSSSSAESLKLQSDELRTASSNLKMVVEGRISVPRFIWKDEYALNIDEMDGEHKILIEKINFLAARIEDANGKSTDKVINAFADLTDYTVSHFNDEEKFMTSFKYPQIEGHKEIHKRLISTVLEFKTKVENNSYNATELMNFLNDWLVSHIMNVDMKYSRHFLNNRGGSGFKKAG